MNINKKRIKILSRGPINSKHGIHGPILTAYMEETKVIFRMVSEGHKVVEVLENGTEIILNAANFNIDNTKKEATPMPVIHEAPPAPPIVITEEKPKEEDEPVKRQPHFNNNKRNRYNRYEEKKETASNSQTLNTQETEIKTTLPESDTVESK